MKNMWMEKQVVLVKAKASRLKERLFFGTREQAMGTLEIVVITGILLTVALIFNTQIKAFAGNLFKSVFNDSKVISNILK